LVSTYKEDLEYNIKAQEVSGITRALINEKGEDIKSIHKETRDFIKKYTKGSFKPIIVGHNMYKFDRPFFENMYEFLGDNFAQYVAGYEDTQIWGYLKYLENTNYRLGTICGNLAVELTGAHRAMADTVSNALMFIEMIKLLRSGQVGTESESKFREIFHLDVKFVY
jgi:DNA polymerase III alpha subunit (gram-positive type)